MKNILILLSAYNGEKHIAEQIQSILNQTFTDWRLLIRDDFSTDRTPEIIDFFCEKYSEKISKISDNIGNVGVVRSFEILLEKSTAEFIMFCDQDDIWLPAKIEKTFSVMQKMIAQNPNKPVLVCTDLQIVDENLQTINNSMWQSSKILPEFLKSSFNYLSVCNFVAGCTMMFNNEVKKIVLPFSNFTEIHDSWIALKTLTHNGLIVPVYEQTILYRQHKNNVFGSTLYEKKYFFKKIKNLQSVIKKNQSHYKMIHQIKKTNIFIYLFYKFKYFLKRQKI